jgi:malate dehydrogenase (oxaloacetate-decarboxylating)
VRARRITDEMAIAAAHSLAGYAARRGITPENIVPTMDETAVFAEEAADVAMQAVRDGVARVSMSREQVRDIAARDIDAARASARALMDAGLIPAPDQALLQEDFQWACDRSGE